MDSESIKPESFSALVFRSDDLGPIVTEGLRSGRQCCYSVFCYIFGIS